MKSKLILVLSLVVCTLVGNAQKIKQNSGSMAALKGQKEVNVQFDYDGLKVGKMTEEAYIKERVKKYNLEETGRGDKWKDSWFNDRDTRYETKFDELINKHLEGSGLTASENATDAKYTLIIKTTRIEPGFNVGITRKPAEVDVVVKLIETANPGKALSETTVTRIPGADAMGFDYDSGQRISEAYAKLGKALAKYIVKQTK